MAGSLSTKERRCQADMKQHEVTFFRPVAVPEQIWKSDRALQDALFRLLCEFCGGQDSRHCLK